MFVKKFECYLKKVIRKQKKGIFPTFIKMLLRPLSWVYRWAMMIRNGLYDRGFMRRYVPPVPLVISIGNIVAGGTGKTPVTIMIAEAFYERFTVAILSRGYRSKAEKLESPVILCEGEGPVYPASYCGDEPFLMALRLPKTIAIVGKDRKAASLLAAKAGAQAILLDDALQHRRLARDFDVIVIDAEDPFGQGYFLPRGFLREDATALKRAHLIILNHVRNPEAAKSVKTKLEQYSSAPIVCTDDRVVGIYDLQRNVVDPIGDALRVGMFCAIGRPEYFRKTLIREGFEVVLEYELPDHAEIHEKKLEQFARSCLEKGARYLICTEKDRVKLHDYLTLSLPVIWVRTDLQITDGKENWDRFLRQTEATVR